MSIKTKNIKMRKKLRMTSKRRVVMAQVGGVGVATALSLSVVSVAAAAECNAVEPALVNPIYGLGGSATRPYIKELATVLANQTPAVTVLYNDSGGACTGPYSLIQGDKASGSFRYWDKTGKESTCTWTAGSAAAPAVGFANMGNSIGLCKTNGQATLLPQTIADVEGPVVGVSVIVPKGSSENSISTEGVYFVFGFGKAGQVSPWLDDNLIIRRNENSFVQLFLAKATGVPETKFKGLDAKTNQASIQLVQTAATPNAAIGFASSDVADDNRASIKTLAYQHNGQSCGYLPDSSNTAFDRKNIRDGHYYLWSAQHYFAFKGATAGSYADPNVEKFIALATGKTVPQGVDWINLVKKAGEVPRCAMQVWRDGDLGELYSYQDPSPCGAAYDAAPGKIAQ